MAMVRMQVAFSVWQFELSYGEVLRFTQEN